MYLKWLYKHRYQIQYKQTNNQEKKNLFIFESTNIKKIFNDQNKKRILLNNNNKNREKESFWDYYVLYGTLKRINFILAITTSATANKKKQQQQEAAFLYV